MTINIHPGETVTLSELGTFTVVVSPAVPRVGDYVRLRDAISGVSAAPRKVLLVIESPRSVVGHPSRKQVWLTTVFRDSNDQPTIVGWHSGDYDLCEGPGRFGR